MVETVYPGYRWPGAPNPATPHLHNNVLQIAAERGLPCLAWWLWWVAAAMGDAYRELRRGGARRVDGAAAALARAGRAHGRRAVRIQFRRFRDPDVRAPRLRAALRPAPPARGIVRPRRPPPPRSLSLHGPGPRRRRASPERMRGRARAGGGRRDARRVPVGQRARISPEAPVPVVEVTRQSFHLGGAGNVACNVRALGGQAVVAGVVGRDAAGERVREALVQPASRTRWPWPTAAGPPRSRRASSPTTSRWCARTASMADDVPAARRGRAAASACGAALPSCGAVVLSDYQKGVVTAARHEVAAGRWRRRAGRAACWSIPRSATSRSTGGVTVVTPNQLEAEQASRRAHPRTTTDLRAAGDGASCAAALRRGARHARRARHGLFARGGRPLHIPTAAREVFDVTGAGDTVIATLALAPGRGRARCPEAAILANYAAGVVVGKLGTATATPDEVLAALEAGRMKVAVVGGGPAGSLLAWHLARDGAARHASSTPRTRARSPAAAGSPRKALAPAAARARRTIRCPARCVDACRFESGRAATRVEVALARPVAIASRRDARRLAAAPRGRGRGARTWPSAWSHVDATGALRTAAGRAAGGSTWSWAPTARAAWCGARSSAPLRRRGCTMAAGWYAPGDAPMLVRFTPGPRRLPVAVPAARPRRRRHLRAAGRGAHARPAGARSSARWRAPSRRWLDDGRASATRTPSRRPRADPASHPRDRRRRAGRWSATRPRWPTPSPARASTTRCARPRCWPTRCARTARRARYPRARAGRTSAATC